MKYQFALLSLGFVTSISSVSARHNAPAAITNIPRPQRFFAHVPAPAITPPPSIGELMRRQTVQETLLAAPDNTCGYFNGSSDAPWGCSQGTNCIFATASTSTSLAGATTIISTQTVGGVLCCPNNSCPSAPVPTACVANGDNEFSSSCTGSCPDDPSTLKCTASGALYCNTLTFASPSISALFCNSVSNTDIQSASTSYDNQVSRSFTPTVVNLAVSTTTSSSSGTKSTTSSSSPSSTATDGTTDDPDDSEGDNPATPSTAVSKGAIIGGAIGGVIALLFGIFAVIMVTRWFRPEYTGEDPKAASKSKDKEKNDSTNSQPSPNSTDLSVVQQQHPSRRSIPNSPGSPYPETETETGTDIGTAVTAAQTLSENATSPRNSTMSEPVRSPRMSRGASSMYSTSAGPTSPGESFGEMEHRMSVAQRMSKLQNRRTADGMFCGR